ncbi:MAG: hypothetical protein AB7G37_10950 [Solirubrobacteraceae bacterium]
MLLVTIVVGVGVALALTLQGRDRYEATARLDVRDLPSPVPADRPDPADARPLTSSEVAARGAAQVLRAGVSEAVARELGTDLPLTGPGPLPARQQAFAARLREELRAEPDPESDEVLVTVGWPDGEVAARLVNLVANATVELVTRETRRRLIRQAEALEATLEELPQGTTGSGERVRRDELVLQVTRLRSAAERATPAIVAARATTVTEPVDRRVPLWAAVGAVGGLLVGLLLVLIGRRRGSAADDGEGSSPSPDPDDAATGGDAGADDAPLRTTTSRGTDGSPDADVARGTAGFGTAASRGPLGPRDTAASRRPVGPDDTTASSGSGAGGSDDTTPDGDDARPAWVGAAAVAPGRTGSTAAPAGEADAAAPPSGASDDATPPVGPATADDRPPAFVSAGGGQAPSASGPPSEPSIAAPWAGNSAFVPVSEATTGPVADVTSGSGTADAQIGIPATIELPSAFSRAVEPTDRPDQDVETDGPPLPSSEAPEPRRGRLRRWRG